MSGNIYTPQQYFVCYIDLLGIRDKLFKDIDYHTGLISPEKQNEINKFSDKINEILETLKKIDGIFHSHPAGLYNYINQFTKCPLSQSEFEQQAKLTFSKHQQFSDSTLIYVPLTQHNQYVAIEHFCSWISALSLIFVKYMSEGIFFRGAITLGTAWELRQGCLFGPAIHEVYSLESQQAKHPRIIISDYLYDYIQKILKDNKNKGINIENLPSALKMIYKDEDGLNMIHYLSPDLKSILDFQDMIPKYRELLRNSFYNLLQQYNHYIKEKNSDPKCYELARRYSVVIRYFLRYNNDWHITSKI